MGALVDHLEARGYVDRTPDPLDGRARVIRLTARGPDVERAARETITEVEAEWARRLGARRMQQFRRTLEDLARQIER